jgi:peptide/nickel transport system substrate-binding protein
MECITSVRTLSGDKDMKIRKLVSLIFIVVLMLTLAVSVQAQGENIVTIAYQQEPDTLSPIYPQLWFTTNVLDLIWAPTWFINDEFEAVPILVTEIPSVENGGVSEDGTTITMTLRDDIVWSDGEPITSADAVFYYEMVMAPSNTPSSRYPWETRVSSVTAPDERTVVVEFNEPFAPWLVNLNLPPLPEHILRPIFEAEGTLDTTAFNREPTVTSGPFLFQEWEAASHMSFVPNDRYVLGRPKLDGIFIRMVPDDATVVSSLLSGDSLMGTFLAFSDAAVLEESGNIVNTRASSGYNEGWFFNINPETAHPAMLDVNVRRALVMAFNRDKINQDLNLGQTYTPSSYWEWGVGASVYANPDAAPLPYDPDAAAQLLDEAGWVDSNGDGTRDKDGVELVLRYVANQRQLRKDVQAVVQQDFADLGIGIELGNFETDVYYAGYADGGPLSLGEYDISTRSVAPNFPDPDTSIWLCDEIISADNPEGTNDQGYCNEEVDALFAEQARTTDPAQRIAIFHQIDALIAQDVIWAGEWFDPDIWNVNTSVLNTEIAGADPFWNAVNWEIGG